MPFYALIRNRGERNCVARRNAKAGRNRLIQRGGMGLDIRIRAETDPPFLHLPPFPPAARPLVSLVKRDPNAGKSRGKRPRLLSPFPSPS